MIERSERRRIALLLRRLASGRITTDDYDAERPDNSPDLAAQAVGDAGWMLYSDSHTHRLMGRHALSPVARRDVARCVLFLQSDLEYEWPPEPKYTPRQALVLLATLGLVDSGMRARRAAWRRGMQPAVGTGIWPFRRRSDLTRALGAPRFLSGERGR